MPEDARLGWSLIAHTSLCKVETVLNSESAFAAAVTVTALS